MDLMNEIAANPRVEAHNPGPPDPTGRCVLYWMRRSQRAFDNPALEAAIAIANQLKLPVAACFLIRPHRRHANLCQFAFMPEGLADTSARLEKRKIGFMLRIADSGASSEFGRLCAVLRPAVIVTARNPLLAPRARTRLIPDSIRVPAFSVDADVIVPTAVIGREHYAARTIRPVIHRHLNRFLQPVGNRAVHVPWQTPRQIKSLRPTPELLDALPLDRAVGPTDRFTGGATAALACLRRFMRDGLPRYAGRRNAPELDATSHLSPYLHFGQIGPHTVALAMGDAGVPEQSRRSFIEELIVQRELAVAFTLYNPHFRSIVSCEGWARRTLDEHQMIRARPSILKGNSKPPKHTIRCGTPRSARWRNEAGCTVT
jgi:deoxyribodipyrimidine photo-lyase